MQYQRVTAGIPTDSDGIDALIGVPVESESIDIDALIGGPVDSAPDDFDDIIGEPTGPRASASAGLLIEKINRQHAVVLNGGRVLIATWKRGKIEFGPLQDLHNWYANMPYGEHGQPVSKWWFRQPTRRQYRGGVTFAPGGAPTDTLNLWTGFALKPDADANKCYRFLWHLKNVICSGNDAHYQYILGWFAHMVQRPEDKPGVALVLKGNRGAGKDAVGDYVSPILGRHAFKLTKSDSLTGRFNRHLGEMIFLHVEEGFWAGDKAAESTLKSLVTSRELTIEAKGIDAINMPSFLRLFISSNEEWVVPSGHDERRWAVFDVSDLCKQDHDYFAQLFKERDSGGAAALLAVLQGMDLSSFDVRAVPWTQGLVDQKMASLSGVEAWWQEVLAEGQMPTCLNDWETDEVTVGRLPLREAYNRWAKDNPKLGRSTSVEHFGRSLHKLVPDIRDTRAPRDAGRTWQYVFPPLSECQNAFDQRFGA